MGHEDSVTKMKKAVNMNNGTEMADQVGKVTIAVGGWVGSWQLADVQVIASIISGTLVAVYTGFQLYFLIRDRFFGKDEDEVRDR